MTEKVALIGAGSAMFTRGLVADALRQGWQGEIALVDVDHEALDVAEKLARKMLDARGSNLTLSASADRRAVLDGATAVICTISVGGREAWHQDVLIPRTYGIYQPVGDSVMPGGTSRTLRMIPAPPRPHGGAWQRGGRARGLPEVGHKVGQSSRGGRLSVTCL